MVEAGTLYAMRSDTYWLDTGTPGHFLEANLDVLQGRRKNKPTLPIATVHPTAQIEESVIGTGSHIDAEVMIERSVLFNDCHISRGATIVNSVLSDEVYVGAGTRLEGCVIGLGQRIEAGATLIDQKRPGS